MSALTSTNPQTVKRYEACMCIGLFSFLIIAQVLFTAICPLCMRE